LNYHTFLVKEFHLFSTNETPYVLPPKALKKKTNKLIVRASILPLWVALTDIF